MRRFLSNCFDLLFKSTCMTSFNQKLVKLASSAYFLTYLFCVWQNLHNGVLEGVSNQAGWSQVFWPPCRVGVYVLNLLSCVSRFCGCRPYYVDCSMLFCMSQGSATESKIFVCTSRSQLTTKSDLCCTLKVVDAKVHLFFVQKCRGWF